MVQKPVVLPSGYPGAASFTRRHFKSATSFPPRVAPPENSAPRAYLRSSASRGLRASQRVKLAQGPGASWARGGAPFPRKPISAQWDGARLARGGVCGGCTGSPRRSWFKQAEVATGSLRQRQRQSQSRRRRMNGAAGPSHIDSRERVLKLGGSFEKQPRCAFHTVRCE